MSDDQNNNNEEIIKNQKSPEQAYDVFSRGSLQLTYTMLRKRKPQLAMTVRNITGHTPLPKEKGDNNNKNSDFFLVELKPEEVRSIIETLTQILTETEQASSNSDENAGKIIVTRSLIEDWLSLAKFMISRLEEQNKPIY